MHGAMTRRAVAALLMCLAGSAARADEPRPAEYYGFQPLEIYKLDPRIMNLLVRDLDGDKTDDIIVVNNARSRIDLLLSSKTPADGDEPVAPKDEANRIVGDRRMRLTGLPVNKEVVSLQIGDFNGDGKPDLAYYGTPAELIVAYNDGKGDFSKTRRINTGEAVESQTALAVGDLNHDRKDDIALLAAGDVVTILQGADGTLGDPERIPHTAANPRMLRATDLDGDGVTDLAIVDGGREDPIRVRLGLEGGKMGPEARLTLDEPRAVAYADVDGKPGQEILTIEEQSGRVKVSKLVEGESAGAGDDASRRGRLIFFPLPRADSRNRSLAIGDLDGDGKADVVVTDPANAQFLVYIQGKDGLGASRSFPGLSGMKAARAADLDGDGKAEIVALSEGEKQVALSAFKEGRLSFPAPLPISGEPVALETGDIDGDGRPEILYAVKNGSDGFALRGLKREASGTFVPFRWGQDDSVPVKGLSGAPPALRVVDADGDRRPDILVFNSYGPAVLLLGRENEPPAPVGGGPGPLLNATPAGVGRPTRGGSGLLVAGGTYARDVALGAGGQWTVSDQFNAGRSAAQIVGAAAIDTDGDNTPEVVLLDKQSRSLLFLDKKDGVYRPTATLPIGPIDFQGMHTADLDGDGRDDLLLAGADRFGLLLTGRKGQTLKTLAGYEPLRKEAVLSDVAVGDINGDGRPDLVLTDTSEHFVEIVAAFKGGADLVRALSFKVFERKSFRDLDRLVEPRDLALGDVDGDGRTDLILLVHDRVLIYRQDAGPADAKAKPVAAQP